ncbi:MAG: GMC family oxidoreductase, partial [Chloroflexi bacterium]|nr:GMC family oxidoreductase [Chloroflexota bacterium]
MSLAEASTSLRAPEKTEPYDVCIIGSGFVGIVVGTSLVEKGVSTVMVESGTSLVRWLLDPRMKELALYEVEGDTNYPTTKTKARARGGNSNFWTGRTERLRPSDFEDNSYTPSGASWPVTYAEMDHYYARAEQLLRVRGAPLSDYYPPRLNGGSILPGGDISSLKNLMKENGVVVDNSPTATPEKGWRTYRPTTELLPKFRKSPHGTLVTGLTVTRLITDADGKITAAEARNMLGEFKTIRAKLFLVACGGIESPRLLLLSRSETFPKGIGNSYDRVGRGFNEHPGVNFYGRFSHRRSTLLPHYRLGRSHQFYDDFKSQGLGGVLPVFIQSWAFPNHLVQYRIKDLARQSKLWLSRMVRPEFYIGASIEMEPVDENRVTLSDSKRDR